MKRLLFGLSTLLICFLLTACGSPADKMKSIVEDMTENGNEWTDDDQWYSVLKDAAQCFIEFSESNPDKESFTQFMEYYANMNDAMIGFDNNEARNACRKAQKRLEEDSDFQKKLNIAMDKMEELEEKFK